jgi:hypothetical protein
MPRHVLRHAVWHPCRVQQLEEEAREKERVDAAALELARRKAAQGPLGRILDKLRRRR